MAIQPVYVQPRAGDVRHSLADVAKAKELLGFRPSSDLLAGLEHALEDYHNHGECIS